MELFNVLGRLIGERVSFIWSFLPWAVQCLGEEAGGIFINTTNRVLQQWSPEARRIATKWRRRLLETRIITQDKGDIVWSIFYMLAYAIQVASWVIVSYITVWIFERIFKRR